MHINPKSGDQIEIIDCFMYNGEPVAEYRLLLLSRVVDRFVILESNFTFSGIKKRRLFSEELRRALPAHVREKAAFHYLENFPEAEDYAETSENAIRFKREAYQRNCLKSLAMQAQSTRMAVFMFSDADEIPDPKLFSTPRELFERCLPALHVDMTEFYYNFKWNTRGRNSRPFITNSNHLAGLDIDSTRWSMPVRTERGGWHLSYFMSSAEIARKLSSFSHSEFDSPSYKDTERVERCIREGRDLFGRVDHLFRCPGEESLPVGWFALQLSVVRRQVMTLDTDKIYWHRYLDAYCDHLGSRDPPRTIVEIGTFRGASAWLLSLMCPFSRVVSVDIVAEDPNWPSDPMISFVQLNQSDVPGLESLFSSLGGELDLIIDDGSHYPQHQLDTFLIGFRYLSNGGIFIIEDAHTSLPRHPMMVRHSEGGGLGVMHLLWAVEHFLASPDDLRRNEQIERNWTSSAIDVKWVYENVSSVRFISRVTLPLRCFNCGSNDFNFKSVSCSCGTELYSAQDSISVVVDKAYAIYCESDGLGPFR